MLGEHLGIAHAVEDCADDLHSGRARDVSDDVVELDVHQHERLLHVLNVRRGVLNDALAMTKQRSQARHTVSRTKTAAQQAVLMQLLQPLCVVDVGLAPRDILHVASIDE